MRTISELMLVVTSLSLFMQTALPGAMTVMVVFDSECQCSDAPDASSTSRLQHLALALSPLARSTMALTTKLTLGLLHYCPALETWTSSPRGSDPRFFSPLLPQTCLVLLDQQFFHICPVTR